MGCFVNELKKFELSFLLPEIWFEYDGITLFTQESGQQHCRCDQGTRDAAGPEYSEQSVIHGWVDVSIVTNRAATKLYQGQHGNDVKPGGPCGVNGYFSKAAAIQISGYPVL